MIETSFRKPRWYFIPVRVALFTFVATLLTFAVTLLLGIVGIAVGAKLRGTSPNMALAYRHVAAPAAAVAAVVMLVVALVMEIRHYKQARVLAHIDRVSR